MHGFLNNLAQLFFLNICLGRGKVKVTHEGQTIKWSLTTVIIIKFLVHKYLKKVFLSVHDVVWLLSDK